MITKNYNITTVNGEKYQTMELNITNPGDDYGTFYQPKNFLINVRGTDNVLIYFLAKGESESNSSGMFYEAGNEYTVNLDHGCYRIKVISYTETGAESHVIISASNYIKVGENYFNGII